jgi:hypothetical protein
VKGIINNQVVLSRAPESLQHLLKHPRLMERRVAIKPGDRLLAFLNSL